MMTTDDAALLRAFESAALPLEDFRHRQHVHVAWAYVHRDGMPDALSSFTTSLKRFAAANGAPGLYHATVTWAYLLLIAERVAARPEAPWDRFAAENEDLLQWKPSILDQFYTPELLWSDHARRTFVMPDRPQKETGRQGDNERGRPGEGVER